MAYDIYISDIPTVNWQAFCNKVARDEVWPSFLLKDVNCKICYPTLSFNSEDDYLLFMLKYG